MGVSSKMGFSKHPQIFLKILVKEFIFQMLEGCNFIKIELQIHRYFSRHFVKNSCNALICKYIEQHICKTTQKSDTETKNTRSENFFLNSYSGVLL